MIKAVIFDMDGVLIDSMPMHYEAERIYLETLGIVKTLEELQADAGTIPKSRFIEYKKVYNLEHEVDKMVESREVIALELLRKLNAKPISGIKELLESVKSEGLTAVVASASPYKFVNEVMEILGIRDYFKYILSGDDVERSKPAPDVFIAAAKKLGLRAEECIVIEDSSNGVEAACSANMKVIGYVNPSSGNQDLSNTNMIIHNFNEIDGKFLKKM